MGIYQGTLERRRSDLGQAVTERTAAVVISYTTSNTGKSDVG